MLVIVLFIFCNLIYFRKDLVLKVFSVLVRIFLWNFMLLVKLELLIICFYKFFMFLLEIIK